MPPKSKPPRKKGKASTSFRKNKIMPVHSGKKFKKTRKMQKKMRKSICDSSFNLSSLSQSAVSTPVGVHMRGVVGKRKAATVSLGEESVPLSGAVATNVRDDYYGIVSGKVAEPTAKKARVVPPENEVVVKDIRDMFRNVHVVESGMVTQPSSSQTVMGQDNEGVEIIVIEDDDEDDDANTSAVEELGQEMLKLVEDEGPELSTAVGQAVPDTPRTVINRLETGRDNQNVTIVLDDTVDDDLVIVDNDNWPPLPSPLQPGNMQEVITRYGGETADFIPIGGVGRRGRGKRAGQGGGVKNRREQGGGRGRHEGAGPLFTVGAPNTQFGRGGGCSTQPRVFGFTGTGASRRGEQGKVVSVGPTMYVGEQSDNEKKGLRPIVIDGSNVAMSHGLHTVFSSRGIELVVKYFSARGHQKIVAFVPQYRSKPSQSTDRELLERLHKSGHLVFTPSREVGSVRITSYDDTFILDYAAMHGGVVITRDNYRDLVNEKETWREVVEKRILMPTFVGDDIMFPHDPLGRNGPSLDQFLTF